MKIKPILALAALLAACATNSPPKKPQSPGSKAEAVSINLNPYPSTYKPYPGVPTVVKNVTLYDGEGGRLNGGAVRFENGKITAIGQSVDEAGATVIDGRTPHAVLLEIFTDEGIGTQVLPGVPTKIRSALYRTSDKPEVP